MSIVVLTTREKTFKGTAKLDRHSVVEYGVDGAVHVDHDAAEHEEPQVFVALRGKRVIHYKRSVR